MVHVVSFYASWSSCVPFAIGPRNAERCMEQILRYRSSETNTRPIRPHLCRTHQEKHTSCVLEAGARPRRSRTLPFAPLIRPKSASRPGLSSLRSTSVSSQRSIRSLRRGSDLCWFHSPSKFIACVVQTVCTTGMLGDSKLYICNKNSHYMQFWCYGHSRLLPFCKHASQRVGKCQCCERCTSASGDRGPKACSRSAFIKRKRSWSSASKHHAPPARATSYPHPGSAPVWRAAMCKAFDFDQPAAAFRRPSKCSDHYTREASSKYPRTRI